MVAKKFLRQHLGSDPIILVDRPELRKWQEDIMIRIANSAVGNIPNDDKVVLDRGGTGRLEAATPWCISHDVEVKTVSTMKLI